MTAKFFDIFSKTESRTKKKKPVKIFVDYREKNSLTYYELLEMDFDIEIKNLNVADYIVQDVAIERKTVSDFVSSMISKRLFRQLQEIQQYKNRLLIIEGVEEQELYTEKNETGMHPNSIRGFLLSILLRYNVPIIFTKDYQDTAKFISVLSRRKSRPVSLNVNKKTLNEKERLQFILEGFPGIGPKTSQKLLKKFRTIKNIANASEKELEDLIGKKAEVLKKLFESNYDEL